MGAKWYVLRIKPHKERAVHRQLLARDIRVYFPSIKVEPVNPRASRIRPYFPGYMFVHIDLEAKGDNVLRWTPGTNGLVRFGGEPARVPENLIQELKKRLANLKKVKEQKNKLENGDRVRIVKGPFEGYEAIFDMHLSGKDRVQVLLAYLNSQPQRVKLSAEALEKVG